MNVQRLKVLADFLRTVPVEKFDITYWRHNKEDMFDPSRVPDEALINECGTTACAMGWACSIPEFKKAGLHWHHPRGPHSRFGYPKFQDEDGDGYDAAEIFFELPEDKVYYLFSPSAYSGSPNPSPTAVAERIELLISMEETQ